MQKKRLESYTNKNISVNIDSVFLLKCNEWKKLESSNENIKGKYILCYILYRPTWLNNKLKEIKKLTGIKIVLVDNTEYRNILRYSCKVSRSIGVFKSN